MGGWWRWAVVSPDGVVPSWTVSVSDSVNLPLHHKVQKFSSGTGSPRCSRKQGRKSVVVASYVPHQLWANMMSSRKPEVHKVLQCRQGTIKPWPQGTGNHHQHRFSAFGLGRRCKSSPQWCYLHHLRTLGTGNMYKKFCKVWMCGF